MRSFLLLVVLAIVVAPSLGCSSGVSQLRATPWMSSIAEEMLKTPGDREIERVMARKVELHPPFKLAVVNVSGDYYGRNGVEESRSAWDELAKSSSSLISKVVFLPSLNLARYGNTDAKRTILEDARRLAAQSQADLLFLYQSGSDTDTFFTPIICVFDLTIVGYYIMPGRTVDSLSIAHGLLIDVKTGVILDSLHGEARKTTQVISALADQYRKSFEEETSRGAVQALLPKIGQSLSQETKRSEY